MPFSHVANSYQPEQLDKLTEAFNLVWPQVVLVNGTATDMHAQAGESSSLSNGGPVRQKLAHGVATTTRGHCGKIPVRLGISRGRIYSTGGSFAFHRIRLAGRVSASGQVRMHTIAGPAHRP